MMSYSSSISASTPSGRVIKKIKLLYTAVDLLLGSLFFCGIDYSD